MASVRVYEPYEGIKENLCIEFFKSCERLQNIQYPNSDFGVHYLDIMKDMHIGFERLQRVLISISHNWGYFKVNYGYTYRGWNVNIEMHKPIVVDRCPILHLRVKKT